MTNSEARLFFPFEEGDDLEELYDDRFFEFKQFFLTKAIVGKVFRAKLEKLKKFEMAYSVLCERDIESFPIQKVEFKFSDTVSEAFLSFEKQKGEIKQRMGLARNSSDLIQNVYQLVDFVRSYYEKWNHAIEIEASIDLISKEPDSMELLKAIRAFESAGGKTFSDIVEQKGNDELQKEMKRVSLLLEKFD